jgi:glycosyltransferase involved in cell wall biosynthesis
MGQDLSPRDVMHIVMIGSTAPIGGTTVSFNALHRHVLARGHEVTVIDTDPTGRGALRALAATLVALSRTLTRADVVTAHFSDRATLIVSPILFLMCRMAGKPFVLRQFGGRFHTTFARLPRWRQALVRFTSLRADAVMLQTKAMLAALAPVTRRPVWFPTARPTAGHAMVRAKAPETDEALRCLYLGRLTRAKGALVAAEAVAGLPGVTLTMHGPLEDVTLDEISAPNVTYAGSIAAEEVAAAMAAHHVLLFPTTHPGEGYSGTLIEAAQSGLPIIANRWQALPEMFSDEEVWFTDDAKPATLRRAIQELHKAPHELGARAQRLREASHRFDASRVFDIFIEICRDVARQGKN